MISLAVQCDRTSAEEVEEKLRSLGATDIRLQDTARRFDGWNDALVIVSSVTSVAASAFQIWVLAKQEKNEKIKVLPDDSSKPDAKT
jgi:Flp pilus assembly protein protease CpaA